MKRKIGFLILFLLLSICIALPAMADEPLYEGTCGDTVNWKYDPDTRELIIFGTGAMNDYINNSPPWTPLRDHIKSISVLEGVTVIGKSAFAHLSVNYVNIAEGVTTISLGAFYNDSAIKELTLPDTITTVNDKAFYGCTQITTLHFTDNLTHIGESAFEGCTALSSEIPIPANMTKIPKACFFRCEALTSIQISQGIIAIEEGAFWGCNSLTEVILPDGLTEIGERAFGSCKGLKSIYIPDTVTKIETAAFADCDSLKTVALPQGITSIHPKLFSGSGIVNIILPNSVTGIGEFAFDECKDLKSITLSESLTAIDYAAFADCISLESITIPASVRSIQNNAFSSCTGLKELYFMGNQFSLGNSSFAGCTGLKIVKFYDCTASIIMNVQTNIAKVAEWICDWRETTVHSAPTHTSEGSSTFTCAKCHKAVTRATEKLKEHVFNPAIPVSETMHKRICICGHEEKSPHNWDEGEIIVEPTKRKEGARVHTCVDCGNKYTEILPKEESAVSPLVMTLLVVGGVAILGTTLGITLWLSLQKKRRAA